MTQKLQNILFGRELIADARAARKSQEEILNRRIKKDKEDRRVQEEIV